MNNLYFSFLFKLVFHPAFKKYKRLTSTPLGRITRDVVVVFTFVMIMIKWQSSPKYQHIYRSLLGTGDLTYSRYVFNVSVTTNTYRSIIGEVESRTLRHSSEAVVLQLKAKKTEKTREWVFFCEFRHFLNCQELFFSENWFSYNCFYSQQDKKALTHARVWWTDLNLIGSKVQNSTLLQIAFFVLLFFSLF